MNTPNYSSRFLAVLGACTLVGLSACIRFPVQLQDATSHLEGPRSFQSLGPAQGKACQFNLFYLIPFGGNQLWKAKERAIGDADGLTDVSVDSSIGLAIIGTVACTEVRGTRYELVKQPAAFQEPPLILEAPPAEELVPDEDPPATGTEPVEQPALEAVSAPEDAPELAEQPGVEADGAPELAPVGEPGSD